MYERIEKHVRDNASKVRKVEILSENIEENGQQLEVMEEEKGPGKRIYATLSFGQRLNILEEFIKYQKDPHLYVGVTSLNQLCLQIAENVGSKQSTVKRLIIDYKKSPAIYVQLQVLCASEKKARRHGILFQRESRITYDKALDEELVNWVFCSMDLGFLLTRNVIKQKAIEIIQPSKSDFKGSDSWLSCFMTRYNLSFRKINNKISNQEEDLQDISDKFRYHIRETIKKTKFLLN